MARKNGPTPSSVCSGRIAWLRRQAKELGADRKAARADKSHTALAALQREIHSIRDDTDAELLRQAELEAAAAPPPVDTPEARRARWIADGAGMDRDAIEQVMIRTWAPAANHIIEVATAPGTCSYDEGDVVTRRRPL